MYPSNVERNKVIYRLWEKGLTVDQISSRTGIPRSTVGYYVRKFSKLAVKGKPVVFPDARKVFRDSPLPSFNEHFVQQMKDEALEMLTEGKTEQLYYFLMDLKLLKELGLLATEEDHRKALDFFGVK